MALIAFILLAVKSPVTQVQLLVWILFVMRVADVSLRAYFLTVSSPKPRTATPIRT